MAARPEDVRMTIGEHIEELRKRVLYSLYAFVVVFFGTFLLHEHVRKYALRPLNDSIHFAIEANKTRIAERFADRFEPVRLLIPHTEGRVLAELYDLGAPIEARDDLPEGVLVTARLPRVMRSRFAPYVVTEPDESLVHGGL